MKRLVHRVYALTFLVTLLFAQTATGFLHDRHDFHEELQQCQDAHTLQKHGDHCKLCCLDLITTLLAPEPIHIAPAFEVTAYLVYFPARLLNLQENLPFGRAPPAIG